MSRPYPPCASVPVSRMERNLKPRVQRAGPIVEAKHGGVFASLIRLVGPEDGGNGHDHQGNR